MSMRDFIKNNKEEIDACIKSASPGAPLNDEERRMWILNDEGMYNWARRSGVKI